MLDLKTNLLTFAMLFSSAACVSAPSDKYSAINEDLSPVWDLESQSQYLDSNEPKDTYNKKKKNPLPAESSSENKVEDPSLEDLLVAFDDNVIEITTQNQPKNVRVLSTNTELEKDEIDYLYLLRPDANIRSEDLKQVVGRAQINDQVYLTGRKQSPEGTNFAYEEVTFADGSLGWVASHLLEPLENPMGKNRVIKVNLSTNRLSFIVDGEKVASWNIGSGRDDLENATPVGSYTLKTKDRCSVWLPKDKQDQGPCRAANPLGDYQLWFHKGRTYALHGTNQEALLSESTTSDKRRVSSGCVRNPNEYISWLYKRVKVGDTIEIGYFGDDSSAFAQKPSPSKAPSSGSSNTL